MCVSYTSITKGSDILDKIGEKVVKKISGSKSYSF